MFVSNHQKIHITVALMAGSLLTYRVIAAPVPVTTATKPATLRPLENSLVLENFDDATFAQWADGKEKVLTKGLPGGTVDRGPAHAVWTKTSRPEWDGVQFGPEKTPGKRYLRVGFKTPVTVGTVIVRGSVSLSVLKSTAAYPGKLDDDTQWVPAQRLQGDKVVTTEVGNEDLVAWVLPPGTSTRAIRLTHTAALTDRSYAGWVSGMTVIPDRVANLAPQAKAQTSDNNDNAAKINDSSNNGTWGIWDNGNEGVADAVSPEKPSELFLTWPKAVSIRGLNALWAGFGAGEVQAFTGGQNEDARTAPDSHWQTIKSFSGLENGYPVGMWPNWIDFGREVSTRAIRVVITAPTVEGHPHISGRTVGGKRVWLGELMALKALGNAELASVIPPKKVEATSIVHAPIPIRFTLPKAGYVTLVIEGLSGKRVRNLVSETYFKAGPNVVWWDGTNDLGRDIEAAAHGLYHMPAQFVAPGAYKVRGLYHNGLDLRYEFSVYNAGQPAWETEDGTGGWLTNHTPPSSALFLPAASAPGNKDQVYLGSYISEGGSGLAWVDLNGRKQGGRGWIGGNWTAAPYLTRDAANKDVYAYVAAPFEGELRLTALTPHGDRPVLPETFKYAGTTDAEKKENSVINGIAADKGLLVATLSKQNQLLFVDADLNRVRGVAKLDDARGLAFDGAGNLLALTKTQLLRYKLPAELAPANILNSSTWIGTASANNGEAGNALDSNPNSRWSTNSAQAPGQSYTVDMKSPQSFNLIVLNSQAGQDSPKGYEVSVSDDGENWKSIAQGKGAPTTTLIEVPRQTVRYLKITQTGEDKDSFWSINSLKLVDGAASSSAPLTLPTPEVLSDKLEDAQGITVAPNGTIYVSDRGNSHQVKAFENSGKLVRAIGLPGAPKAGKYNPGHMNNPKGITIDSNNRLWVTEEDYQPKRVSVWNTETGALWKALYGPSQYGGGGTIDYKDKTRFYYTGMEFKLDWQKGTNEPVNVFFRPGEKDLKSPDGYGNDGPPETPLYAFNRQYMTNCFNSLPTSGSSIAMLWVMKNGIAVPVAAMGRASDWSLLKKDEFVSRYSKGADGKPLNGQNQSTFLWVDKNADAQVQPAEVTTLPTGSSGMTVMPDLSFVVAVMDGKTMKFTPASVSAQGIPQYDLKAGKVLVEGAQGGASSGGEQALVGSQGWTIHTNAPKPFSNYGVGGSKNGVPMWSYPSMWPGLHASHEADKPSFPGQLIGTTRLIGSMVTPKGEAGPIWGINGNMGNMYLLTQDGLFVSTLFHDVRTAKLWTMPIAKRNMRVNDLSLHDENFWPTMSQTPEGVVYVNSSLPNIVRVDGLDTVKRLPESTIRVTTADLKNAQAYLVKVEAERQKNRGTGKIVVEMRSEPPVIDGKLDDWAKADWATIDKSGAGANFNSNSKPYDYSGAVTVAGDSLYAAWRTADPNLLRNTGEVPNAPFKTGGSLDLMIGTNPEAAPNRTQPVEGDLRLLVTIVKDKPLAMLYHAVVPGTQKPVPFSSPWRTINIDKVEDVSSQITFVKDDAGNYEIKVPLALLGLNPQNNQTIKGDIGILRGNGFQTQARVYWNNKATGITSDVPSEAQLTPNLWGQWQFKTNP